uniref:Integrase catalytic domain-containing protein n=1 Tax=Lepeophtheirus salmonis TaxID=72036 RepID=A0A0K2TCR1_LEPSM
MDVSFSSDYQGVKGLLGNLRRFFANLELPEEILSNNGLEFVSYETAEVLKKWGFT